MSRILRGTAQLKLLAVFWSLGLFLSACSGAKAHIQRGDELLQANLPEQALAEYRQASEKDPENPQARARVAQVQASLAQVAGEEGKLFLQNQDFFGAVAAFRRAVALKPQEPMHRKNLSQAVAHLLAAARKQQENNEFKSARSTLEQLRKQLPQDGEVKQALGQAKYVWAKKLYADAEQFLARDLFGNALAILAQVHSLVGVFRESAALEVQAREKLEQTARFGIEVLPSKTKKRFRDSTAGMVQQLRQISVEKCPTVAMPAEGKPKIKLRVAVSKISFEQDKDLETGEQKYQSGTRKVDNPVYLKMQEERGRNQARIGELAEDLEKDDTIIEQSRQAFADAGPDDDEESLRSRLQKAEKLQAQHRAELSQCQNKVDELREKIRKTPAELDEPVYDTFNYDIKKITRKVEVTVKWLALGDGGVRLEREELTGQAEVSDSSHQARPKYGVSGDPLVFDKNDEEIIAEALAQVSKEASGRCSVLCAGWQDEILSRANQAAVAAVIEATEDYVLYLFVKPGPPPSEVVRFFQEQFELSDLDALRGIEKK